MFGNFFSKIRIYSQSITLVFYDYYTVKQKVGIVIFCLLHLTGVRYPSNTSIKVPFVVKWYLRFRKLISEDFTYILKKNSRTAR